MVSEAPSAKEIKEMMARKGMRVEERQGGQMTLDGRRIGHHSVTGYKPNYKVTVRLKPEPSTVSFVVDTGDERAATRLASRLDEELGIDADVDKAIVRGSARTPSRGKLEKLIDMVDEAAGK